MEMKFTAQLTFTAAVFFILTLFLISITAGQLIAQTDICGDVDCDGKWNLADHTKILDYFLVSHALPSCYWNMDFDQCGDINFGDYLLFKQMVVFPGDVPGCNQAWDCFPDVPDDLIEFRIVSQPDITGGITEFQLDLYLFNTPKIEHVSAGFIAQSNGLRIDSTNALGKAVAEESLYFLYYGVPPDSGQPGWSYLHSYYFSTVDWQPGDSAIIDLQDWSERGKLRVSLFPNTGVNALSYIPDWEGPLVIRDIVDCCGRYTGGYTGNVNCDPEGRQDLEDITLLIGAIYKITQGRICCFENANVNGDINGFWDLADITRLIDHVYISKEQTAACQ